MENLKEILVAIYAWCSDYWVITYIVGGIITYFVLEKINYTKSDTVRYFNAAIWFIMMPVFISLITIFSTMFLFGFLFSLPAKIVTLIQESNKNKDDDYYCHI